MIAPLIVSLKIADPDFSRFTALRRQHFPPDRNYLPAHVTLFHKLPGDALAMVCDVLSDAVSTTSIGPVHVTRPRFLGQGVALDLSNGDLLDLRRRLAMSLEPLLEAQDRQPWRPHITIQNKVDKATASALFEQLVSTFEPSAFETPGLDLWRYLGGPWEHVSGFRFPRS